MNILIYTKTYRPNIGGVERYIEVLAHGLVRVGEQVVVFTESLDTHDNTTVQPTEENLPKLIRSRSKSEFARAVRQADIVHLAGAAVWPMQICRRLQTPFVVEHHNYQAICPNGLLLKYPGPAACVGHYMRKEYGQCLSCQINEDDILTACRRLASMPVRRRLLGKAAANIGVTQHVAARIRIADAESIYHGLPDVDPTAANAATNDGPVTFGFVGRLVPEKGVGILIEAAAELAKLDRACNIKIIGGGPLQTDLQALAKQRQVQSIDFSGWVSPDEIETAAADIDVLILPSIWEETAGLVVIEQMARGRAMIVADIGGVSEVAGDVALKFPAGDVSGLAEQMQVFCDQPELVDRLGQMARQRYEDHFHEDLMVHAHRECYRAILAPT